MGSPHKDESTEAEHRGGATRIRVEGSVMAVSYTHLDVYKRQFLTGSAMTKGAASAGAPEWARVIRSVASRRSHTER